MGFPDEEDVSNYKEQIKKMVESISSYDYIGMIYYFVEALYKKEG